MTTPRSRTRPPETPFQLEQAVEQTDLPVGRGARFGAEERHIVIPPACRIGEAARTSVAVASRVRRFISRYPWCAFDHHGRVFGSVSRMDEASCWLLKVVSPVARMWL